MTSFASLRRAVLPALAASAMICSAAHAAKAQGRTTFPHTSVSGNFLAARHAGVERDAGAAAAYYRAALRGDPQNKELLNRAFLAVLATGQVDEAVGLAERAVQADKNDRIARLVLGVRSLKQKHYGSARRQLARSVRGPITDLAAALLTAWTHTGRNDSKAAVDTLEKLAGPDWYSIFKELHSGLLLDVAGYKREAGKHYERAYKLDPTALRVVEAYGGYLSRDGKKDEALKVFKAFDEVLPNHPLITKAIKDINAGRKVSMLVDSSQEGAAEALYGLGAALGRRGGEDLGLVYLQLALYLSPGHPMALLSLADLYEAVKKPELAIKTYERLPKTSPMYRNARIQRAIDLDALNRTEEAKADLHKLVASDPKDVEAIMALGNILRVRKQFAECADVYSKGVNAIAKPERANWVIFYFRGICYERSKQWPKAEADMKEALKLYPNQPLVLNYLGYSWIDQGINLDEGMTMIKRAVAQRADDGYIVDSLGWAYYKLGKYDEAVKQLERAVELKPEDPTINDHLGDVYWKVGRELEARFQWAHARDLKPEPEDLAKIEAKLKSGLPADTSSAARIDKPKKPGGG